MNASLDAGCKVLVSNPAIVRVPVSVFIDDPWVQGLDLDMLEKIRMHFVYQRSRQRIGAEMTDPVGVEQRRTAIDALHQPWPRRNSAR